MRSKLITGLLISLVAFLLITNPVVSQAAGQITGKQIKNGSVTGKDIKDNSITTADVSGSISGPQGPAGPTGLTGPPGSPGAPGAAGSPGISGYTVVTSDSFVVNPGSKTMGFAYCPSGTVPLGGGEFDQESGTSFAIHQSGMYGTDAWRVDMNNTGSSIALFKVRVECARVVS